MRTGLSVSLFSHSAIVALAVLSLNFGETLPPPPEDAIAVDIVPVSEFSNVRVGSLQSEVVETPTPAIVETEVPAELAQPTGNTTQDQATPIDADRPTPAPTEQTAPEPVPEPEPDPVVEPEPDPAPTPDPVPETVPEPDPAPVPAPEPDPEPEPEPAPVPEPEPAPVPVEAPPELTAEPAPEAPPEIVAPRPVVRTAELQELRESYASQQRQERQELEADRVSDIINAEESRGAVTGEGGQASLGRPDGQAATLTQSELAALAAQMRKCWNLLPAQIQSGLSVNVRVNLNQDGSVAGTPRLLTNPTNSMHGLIGRQAQRAVMSCGPYRLPTEKYAQWAEVEVTFRASDVI